jgi:hypothetical protein
MIVLMDDGLCLCTAFVVFREDLSLLQLADGYVESSSSEICCSNLEGVSGKLEREGE